MMVFPLIPLPCFCLSFFFFFFFVPVPGRKQLFLAIEKDPFPLCKVLCASPPRCCCCCCTRQAGNFFPSKNKPK
ncbi:hypothetical protein QBC44DRAFT_14798 [Cladorrhinum sp. PSN332]|nr:hypothetical protein QBC44DRAFT_14798 [Cladorrhinum sp. PSN332]